MLFLLRIRIFKCMSEISEKNPTANTKEFPLNNEKKCIK